MPVLDNDNPWLNYLGHPWIGGWYYIGSRDYGASEELAFKIAIVLSTIFEYAPEAIVERPSIHDLITTPIGGYFLGEYFFIPLYKYIESDGGKLLNSSLLGFVTKMLINPISIIPKIFSIETKSYLSITPEINPDHRKGVLGLNLTFCAEF